MFSLLRRSPGGLIPRQARQQAEDGTAVVFDVRESAEWEAGHAPGAPHLPLSRPMAGAPLPAAARGRSVVTVCHSGRRSRQAVKPLTGRGVRAAHVAGGMTGRARVGLPVIGPGGSNGVIP